MNASEKTYNQIAGQKIQRLEAISDGVFAIAMTLLVLDIRVPVSEAIKTEADLFDKFCTLTPRLLSYFLSFMTLGIFWTGHSTQFNYIHRSDRRFNWITLYFLLFVTLLPFTTAFLSEHIEFKFSIGLYWLNIFLMGVFIYLSWVYAHRHNLLSIPENERSSVNKAIRRRIIIAQTLYFFGALCCFINTYLSIGIIILIQINYAFAIITERKK